MTHWYMSLCEARRCFGSFAVGEDVEFHFTEVAIYWKPCAGFCDDAVVFLSADSGSVTMK